MKLNKINAMFAATAVVFGLTACADTDAQYEVPTVSAPTYASVTPADGTALIFGEKTIKVKFDRKVNFATKNAEKITLNGKPVKKALVLGADSTLTITVDVNFDTKQTLIIPANLVTNAQGTAYDKEINLTWEVKDLPINEASAMTHKLGWGFNLGNHFDTSDTQWGYWDKATPTKAFYEKLAATGAKTIRIPATWTNHMNEENIIDAAYLDEVAQNVSWAIEAGLNVILNTHHDSFEAGMLGNASTNPQSAQEAAQLIRTTWEQIAKKFANYGEQLIFETFNEVHSGDDWSKGSASQFSTLNEWNELAVQTIRSTGGNNATRWIGISGYAANIDMTLNNLVLPKKADSDEVDNRVMVGVHCYDPGSFCQTPYDVKGDSVLNNSWGHNADPYHANKDCNEEYIINQLYKLRTNYIEKGIPCYLGEYGCVNQPTDNANAFRNYYLEFFCRAAYQAGIPVMIWDNNSVDRGNEAFGYINHDNGEFINDGATLIPMMIKAATSTDATYSFYTIWEKSPVVVK